MALLNSTPVGDAGKLNGASAAGRGRFDHVPGFPDIQPQFVAQDDAIGIERILYLGGATSRSRIRGRFGIQFD